MAGGLVSVVAKRGPKPKINDKVEADIIACLTVGASLRDACDYVGLDYKTIYNRRRNDEEFSNRLNKAVKKGKILHIKKIGKAPQWQASAFMLERKWWKEYGRRDRVKAEHTGQGDSPIRIEVIYRRQEQTLADRMADNGN